MDTAIIAAAGESSRMGGKTSKLFIEICGKPVLLWSIEPAFRIKSIGRIIVAIRSTDVAKCRKLLSRIKGPEIEVISGGVTRAETIKLALKAAETAEPGLIVIHDGARPCASVDLWKRVMAAANTNGAAVPALPITDTIKALNDDGSVENTVSRMGLARIQTPQAFADEVLRNSFKKVGKKIADATDDASIVEMAGHRVVTVPGESRNIKLTYKTDTPLAECFLSKT